MAGEKTIPSGTDEAQLPPNEAGRQVLTYVQKMEKEADAEHAAMYGGTEEEPGEDDDKTGNEKEEEEAVGEEPAEAVVKEEEVVKPDSKDKTAEAEDLTKGLNTENAQKRISSAQTRMHESNSRANTAEGERDRLKAENERLTRQWAEMPRAEKDLASKEVADTAKKVPAAHEDDDLDASMEELNNEYPEIAKPMLKIMARQEIANKKLMDKVGVLEEREATREAEVVEAEENSHIGDIAAAHADWQDISEDPLLDEYIEGLPSIERAGAKAIKKNGSTEDVIELITNFKTALGYELPASSTGDIPKKKSNSKLDKAKSKANPSFKKAKDVNLANGGAPFTRRQIDAMSMAEYKIHEPAIDDAMSKGFPPQ